MLPTDPPPTSADLNFRLFGIPVRVHPWFWIVALLLGMSVPDPVALLIWIAAVFVAVLIHELGHAAMMRAYGYFPSITLYAMGGYTSYGPGAFHARNHGTAEHLSISAAGPAAGFAFAALLYGLLRLAGYDVIALVGLPFVVLLIVPPPEIVLSAPFTNFINDLLFISVFWGIVNLLPIYPLDGGHIARSVLVRLHPTQGTRWSLMLSFLMAVLVAVMAAVQWRDFYAAIFFGYLAYGSYMMLAVYGGLGRWP